MTPPRPGAGAGDREKEGRRSEGTNAFTSDGEGWFGVGKSECVGGVSAFGGWVEDEEEEEDEGEEEKRREEGRVVRID